VFELYIGGSMICRALLKSEIDKVKSEYLDLPYRIVKVFASSASQENVAIASESQGHRLNLDWQGFVERTYGCMADSRISRGEQGISETREKIE